MQLWPAEVEAMREEARQAVATGIVAIEEALGERADPAADRLGRVHEQRARFARLFVTVPEATERAVAGVRCRVFVPDGAATGVYLDFHGGGMIIGAPELNDLANRDLCRRLGLAVVSVDYRLAPEHPFPAGPDDGLAVATWLLHHAEAEFGSSRLFVGGESAGGYMAAAVLLRIRDELGAIDRVAGAKLVFGVYDWGGSPSQRGLRAHHGPDILSP